MKLVILRDQLAQWMRETGEQPTQICFKSNLFDHLCAEAADIAMKSDKSILSIVESFKFAGPNGNVIVKRDAG